MTTDQLILDMPKTVSVGPEVMVKMPQLIEKMSPEIVLTLDKVRLDNVHFGVVPVGETKVLTLEMENIGGLNLTEIQVDPGHADVIVTKYPAKLDVNERQELILSYTPATQIDRGISTDLKITGKYVV